MEELDPIAQEMLDQGKSSGLLEDGKAEYDEAYGIGKWPAATLTDVIAYDATDYGYRLGLKLNLKGEDGMPFTGRIDLPRTLVANGHEVQDWQTKKEDGKRAVLNRGLAALGYTSVVKKNIDDQEAYDTIVALFRAKVGGVCPVQVKADGKKVKGADGKWTFEPNGFARVDFMRRPKGK